MKNEIVKVKCVDMSIDGQGIAKSNDLVVFVKEMIKGEEADVKIISEKKNYSYGIINTLTKPSIHRVNPDCPVAYKCGGCDYRHIDYDYQLEIKKDILINTLKEFNVLDIIKDDDPYYYRNKVQIPVRDHKMGFYRRYSNDIVVFDDCLLENKQSNEIITFLKTYLVDNNLDNNLRHIVIKHSNNTNQTMVCFVVRDFDNDYSHAVKELVARFKSIKTIILNLNDKDTNVILGTKEKILYGDGYIVDEFDGIKVKISLKSFYQVNHNQMLKLYRTALDFAEIDNTKDVLDLYCGIGTISLYVSRYAKHVTGVEIVEPAIINAKDNAKMNNINNCDFVLADAGKNMNKYIQGKDVVIVDPPRKGITKELIDTFIANKTKRIVYVSCNPATLNRDLILLKDYYNISDIQPVDMFGFTTHAECVCRLDYKK